MLTTQRYLDQLAFWPPSGRHILAQYDTETIIVYQAYRQSIGSFVIDHGYFGGEFSYQRMSWIKTNFLWMMYRSGWGMKPGQEVILAIRLARQFFDSLLAQAVASSYNPGQYSSYEEWEHAVSTSLVRMQWDPDHHPSGPGLPRRALQLGLRGRVLMDFGKNRIIEVLDISAFVARQRENRDSGFRELLETPLERVYLPADPTVCLRIQLDQSLPNDVIHGATFTDTM